MGVVNFCVEFDKSNKTYSAGEILSGRVVLEVDSVKKIRGIELKIKGRAKCEWEEGSSERSTTYSQKEIYINSKQILNGGKGSFELPPGEHIYPFSLQLPSNAPSTFTSTYGEISYYAKAKIDIPMAFDKTQRSGFTVVNRLDLNLFPDLRKPYKDEKVTTFCCLCCESGPLSMVVLLPKTGFAISESIPITIEIDNASNRRVCSINVQLKEKICWKARGSTKVRDNRYQTLSLRGVDVGDSRTMSENFTFLPTSFEYIGGCSIINICHTLNISVNSFSCSGLDLKIPITLGHIPLSENPNVLAPQIKIDSSVTNDPAMQQGTPKEIPMAMNPPIPSVHPTNDQNSDRPSSGAPVEVPHPSQISPSAPPAGDIDCETNAPTKLGSVVPDSGGSPHISSQEPSQPNRPSVGNPPSVNPVSGQQYRSQAPSVLSSSPPQLATNLESSLGSYAKSQGAEVDKDLAFPSFDTNVELNLLLSSFDSNVEIKKTSFLDDSKDPNVGNAVASYSPLSSSSKARPPS